MIVNVNSQLLAAELRMLNKVVPSKPAIAILGYVMLRAEQDALHFYATDLEVAMDSTLRSATISKPGCIALPMAKFLALVEQFADADVEIREEGASVMLRCQGFKTKLQTLSVDDFPTQPAVTGATSKLDAPTLRDAIRCTRYAVQPMGQISAIKGALLNMSQTEAVMVTTDTKRIAINCIPLQETPGVRVVIPAKTLDLLEMQEDTGQLEFTVGERHLFFSTAGRHITSRVIEAEFPNYLRAIPKNHDKFIEVNRIALSAALRRVVLISEDDQAVTITLGQNSLTLDSASASVGSADEIVPCAYTGEALKVCVNGGYVLDFLEATQKDTVTLSFRTNKDPMMIAAGPEYITVILLIWK